MIVSFAVYFTALFNGFVYDDGEVVVENAWIKDARHIPDIFLANEWGFTKDSAVSSYYRPMMHLILMGTYAVFGLHAWGFHLVNILFHVGTSVLVFLVALRLFSSAAPSSSSPSSASLLLSPPFIAAILFATHPIHVEPVAWISSLMDLSYSFFFLTSLYFYVRYRTDPRKDVYTISLLAFSAALLCKEPAVTLPVVLVAYDLAYRKRNEPASVIIKNYIPFFIILGIYFIARTNALGSFAPLKSHAGMSMYQYIINIFPLFIRYLEKIFFPFDLNAFYVLHFIPGLSEPEGIFSLLVSAGFGVTLIFAYRKNRTAFFSLMLFVIPLLPALYIPGLGRATLAERYLYLPSAGFVLLIAMFATWLRGKMPKYGLAISLGIAALAGLYSAQTITRIPVWKDNLTLFTEMVKKTPQGELPRGMLGKALSAEGRTDEAIEQFRLTLKYHPNSLLAYKNLGRELMKNNLPQEAIEEYKRALKIAPKDLDLHGGLADAYEKAGMTDEMAEQYRTILKLRPDSASAHTKLAIALAEKGQTGQAVEHYEKALSIDPDYVDAHYNLGSLYANSGRMDDALIHFETAARLRPDNAFYHNILGIAFGEKRRYDEAIKEFRKAIEIDPEKQAYRRNLERASALMK